MPRANHYTTTIGMVGQGSSSSLTPVIPNIPVTAAISSEVTSGVSRPKPSGFIYPTPYYFKRVRIDLQRGSCLFDPSSYDPTDPVGQQYVGIVGAPDGPARFNGSARFGSAVSEETCQNDEGLANAALIAVRLKLKSTDINLGVAFGERKATARLLGDTATRLARSVRSLRRGEIRNAMNQLGISSSKREPRGSNVPQKWLELQYGWKPLLSDVYGAATALENRPKGDWRVTAKATRSLKKEYTYTFPVYPGFGSSASPIAGVIRARVDKSVFARIDALPQNEAAISLASLGVTNPLVVVWELVPWSFVVDWALPIGNYLDSLDALLGYGDVSFSSSFRVKAEWTDKGLSGQVGWTSVKNSYFGRKRLVFLERTPSTSVPLPSLPRFKDPRSLGHMANGLALLATAFGRR